jgi:thiamine-monophosphate kinase
LTPTPGTPSHNSPIVAELGERALIARVRERAGAPPPFVRVGIGDDGAVMETERGELDVVTTDAFVEQIHFRRDWTAARSIGAKSVAVNLSDLAAMGATPRAILLSLILPGQLTVADFDAVIDGAVAESTAAGASLVGGNISRSPGPLVIDVTAMGSVGRRRALLRSGGRPGDELYVTGSVGGGAAGLAILLSGANRAALSAEDLALVERYERPSARVRCGRLVAASRSATACMDLSDGLADAVRQIAEASGTGAVIDAAQIPLSAGAPRWMGREGRDPIEASIAGGDDYELLFAVPPRKRRGFEAAMLKCRPVAATRIGRLTRERDLLLARDGQTTTLNFGFRHF